MASKRQIDANRINAVKSTGPKTDDGKRLSSLNALRHGLSAALRPDEVTVAYFRVTGEILPDEVSATDVKALRMAMAAAQLARAQSYERKVMVEWEDPNAIRAESELVDDILASDRQRDMRLLDLAAEMIGLKRRNSLDADRAERQAYKRARRFLRRAEREYDRALREWVSC